MAEDFAGPGVHLALSARTEARLADVREACLAKGATVEVVALDVTEQEAMEEWVQAVDAAHPLDLVVANAGVSAGTLKSDDLSYLSRAVFDSPCWGMMLPPDLFSIFCCCFCCVHHSPGLRNKTSTGCNQSCVHGSALQFQYIYFVF